MPRKWGVMAHQRNWLSAGCVLALITASISACSSGSANGGTAASGGSAAGGSGGSGAVSGSGGSGGSGATGGSGGASGGSPGTTQLSFELPAGKSYCRDSDTCSGHSSISIKDSSGKVLARFSGDCIVPCDTCELLPCPGAACLQQGFAVKDETITWDGTYFDNGTCNQTVTCVATKYAAPGKYTAVMCARPGDLAPDQNQTPQCTYTGPQECVEVPFDFPSSQPYTGKLP